MRRMLTITSATLLLWGGLLLGGCGGSMPGIDLAPAPPRTANWRLPDKLAVAQGNNEELTAVTDSEKARVNYRYRLVVLRDYYRATGSMDKLRWAERELGNLDNAYTFTWEGIPRIEPPPGESLAGADEHVLVEYAVAARREFLAGLDKLLAYYQSAAPNAYKTRRVANVKARFDPVRTYVYFLEAEVPPGDLKPVEVNPAADALYQAAYRDYYYGKGILGFAATTDYARQRRALAQFLELVHRYPRSTKIGLAAYFIGEIYKEYFNENVRAVLWYERAWQWDPGIPLPARFQAATVHDLRLFNRAKAIECYRQAIIHEQFSPTNVQFAHRRIAELTGT